MGPRGAPRPRPGCPRSSPRARSPSRGAGSRRVPARRAGAGSRRYRHRRSGPSGPVRSRSGRRSPSGLIRPLGYRRCMDVLVVGGHGKVAMRLMKLLGERGHSPRGVIRNPEQVADLEAIGAEPILLDIENKEIDDAVAGSEAVVFAAGAGAGSGPARKRTVDYAGAVNLMEAAVGHGIRRYLMVSAIGANHPERWSDEMRPYYEAKAEADKVVMESGLDYTVVRPGSLTDEAGTGKVSLASELQAGGSISRDDVALVLVEVLEAENTFGKAFDLLGGDVPVPEAVAAL